MGFESPGFSAPDGRVLQHRGQVDRANGRRRAGRPGEPCRAAVDLPGQGWGGVVKGLGLRWRETEESLFLEGYVVVVALASPARRYGCATEANGWFAI